MTGVILIVTVYTLSKLSSGQNADLSALSVQALSLLNRPEESVPDQSPGGSPAESNNAGRQAEKANSTQTAVPRAEQNAPQAKGGAEFSLTVGGTAAIEDNVRRSGYSNDTKKYDFTDIMTLLSPEISADINAVFTENLMTDDIKVSRTVVPSCAANMLKTAGFDTALAGFSKAWDKGMEGVAATVTSLKKHGLAVTGLCSSESDSRALIRRINGVQVAMLQYTATVGSNTRKSMVKKGESYSVPEALPELIASDIAQARQNGSRAVFVFLNWGKTNSKAPDKSQIQLAQQIADAGADLIIGAGSRIAQKAEYLTAADGRSVLCAYSLGTLISDDRNAANRIGGYLLHLTFRAEENGTVSLIRTAYTPTYTWRYRQDGSYFYRVVAADRPSPDGMDSDQIKAMRKTLTAVQAALEESPLSVR